MTMTLLVSAPTVVAIATGLALSIAAPASAQTIVEPPSTPEAESPRRHELAATVLWGLGRTESDYYDRLPETAIAFGLTGEYGYRFARFFCVGAEGAGIAINNSQGALGSLWSAMPFVGLHFGSRSIEAGLRAGVGFAYGGREEVRNITDRSGAGVAAQAFAEIAVLGSTVDFIGRLGVRYTRVAWSNEPAQVLYPTDFPAAIAFASVGARFKL